MTNHCNPNSTPVADVKDWRIDTSAGRPILVYKNCSVIEAEDAEYVLRLIAADQASAPVADERAALQKLVDLEDMRLRLRNLHERGHGTDYDHYYKALDAAWAAARAALASAPVAGEALGWRVRERRGRDGELLDCFVEAPAAPGMAYAQEVLGDDYAEAQGGIEGKLKHCQMIVAWANATPRLQMKPIKGEPLSDK